MLGGGGLRRAPTRGSWRGLGQQKKLGARLRLNGRRAQPSKPSGSNGGPTYVALLQSWGLIMQ